VNPSVVIVGPPGSGKTTVGRLLAERLGVAFVDTDEVAATAAGKSVPDIFIEDGEERFRELERAAVVSTLQSAGADSGDRVVALGGGAVLNPATRADLQGQRVVALSVDLTDAVKRVGLARDRPLLVEAPRARMSATLRERAPLYAEVADLTVDTSQRTPDDVAEEVLAWLSQQA
jgi:shikimate kinase